MTTDSVPPVPAAEPTPRPRRHVPWDHVAAGWSCCNLGGPRPPEPVFRWIESNLEGAWSSTRLTPTEFTRLTGQEPGAGRWIRIAFASTADFETFLVAFEPAAGAA